MKKYIADATTISSSGNEYYTVKKILDYDGNPFKYSAILKHTHSGTINCLIGISNSNDASGYKPLPRTLTLGGYSTTIGVGYYNGTDDSFVSTNRINHTMPTNTEYLMEMELNSNNQLSTKITRVSDSSVLFTDSRTLPIDITGYKFAVVSRGSGTVTYRDLKIKPL